MPIEFVMTEEWDGSSKTVWQRLQRPFLPRASSGAVSRSEHFGHVTS